MGWNPVGQAKNAVKRGTKYVKARSNVAKALRNPEAALLSAPIRNSTAYRTIGRPIIKTAGNIAGGTIGGFITGGPAGAVAGATSGLVRGVMNDGNSSGFSLRKNLLQPAVVGAAGGYVAGSSGYGQAFNEGVSNAQSAGLNMGESLSVGFGRAGGLSMAQGLAGSGSALSTLGSTYQTVAPMLNNGVGLAQQPMQQGAPIAALAQGANPTGASSNKIQQRLLGQIDQSGQLVNQNNQGLLGLGTGIV